MQINGRQISKNVISSTAQVVVTGICFFVLYRFLLNHLGASRLGIWSLVLATTSFSRIGDLGLSAGVVRFVSQVLSKDDERQAAAIIQTTTITLALGAGLLLLILYPIVVYALRTILPNESVVAAIEIAPYAMCSVWALMVSSVSLGALDGCQRIDLRCTVNIFLTIFYVSIALLVTPTYGLKGLAQAQLAQSLLSIVLSWGVLKSQIRSLPVVPNCWNKTLFVSMLHYGTQFQLIGFVNAALDPVLKALMSSLGGLAMLGYYEVSSKFIIQLRSLLVEANRVLIPLMSALHERSPADVSKLFVSIYKTSFFVSVAFYSCVTIMLPLVSLIWFGTYQSTFIEFTTLLSAGWMVNTFSVPAFFANLGTGNLKENLLTQCLISILGILFALGLGFILGGYGVVTGAAIGLAGGSLFLIRASFMSIASKWYIFVIPDGVLRFSLTCLGATIFAICLRLIFKDYVPLQALTATILIPLVAMFWAHPIRKQSSFMNSRA